MENDSILDGIDLTQDQHELAGFWVRVGASLLDSLFLSPIIGLNLYVLYYVKSFPAYAAVGLLSFFYKPIMEGVFGATLGKMVCKIKVTDTDFNQITLSKAFVRAILWLFVSLSALLEIYPLFEMEEFMAADGFMEVSMVQAKANPTSIGFIFQLILLVSGILIAFKARRGIHDYMASSLVVYTKKREQKLD